MLALGFCLLWWLRRERLLRLTGLAMALLAVSILVYTGAEVMVVRARPLWNTLLLPWNFAVTGWLAALGAMLLVGRWLPGGLGAMPMELLRRLGISALVLVVLGVLVWVATGSLGLDPSFPAALRLFEDFPVWRLSLLGAVLSGVLMLVMLARPAARLGGAGYSPLGALVMLGSGVPLGGVHERAGRTQVRCGPLPVQHAAGRRRVAGHPRHVRAVPGTAGRRGVRAGTFSVFQPGPGRSLIRSR